MDKTLNVVLENHGKPQSMSGGFCSRHIIHAFVSLGSIAIKYYFHDF